MLVEPRKSGQPAGSVRAGLLAAAAMGGFYAATVAGASGSWEHLGSQVRQDWYLLVLILGGFGLQVGLLSELRRRHRLDAAAVATGGAGATAASAGMVACCAHHLVELFGVVGVAGVAGFLADYRGPFMVAGIGINALAVFITLRALRRHPARHDASEVSACAIA